MDIALVNVLLRMNRTPSPPNNVSVNSRQQPLISNTTEVSALLNNTGRMEANNLSQTAAGDAFATAARDSGQASDVTTTAANESYTERNLALKLPLLSSSSSESESENPTYATAGTSTLGDGERTSSPPPNCAICLGRCKNKCFTDSCMHQFCFKCLCEWSKVKPECPLCKQTFKSIIHNVKSIHQFEEYHVQPPTVQIAHPPFEMDFQEMRIFGVVHPGSHTGSIPSSSGSGNRSMALSGNGGSLHNQYIYRGELLDLYRQDNPGAIANSGTLSQLWRRYVYDRKLYAMPVADVTGRFRECNARFYRDNPSQIHRLMPWINRDIVCLLRQTQHDVTTVLESINSALTLLNILSPAFRRRLQPYLGTKTAHFIHELYNFARSPYDMIGYDRAVQYSLQTNEEIIIEFTSSDESTDNEHSDVARDVNRSAATTMSTRSSRSTQASSTNAINLTIHNRLTSSASSNTATAAGGQSGGANAADIPDDVSLVIDLRGESDNNETISTGQATINSSIGQNVEVGDVVVSSVQQPTVAENIELTSGSSDECEFILERKPPHLRTPEMVSLDSASDSDVVFVDESKPLNKTSFSSSEDDERNGSKQRDLHNHHYQHQHNTRNSASASTRSQITALVEAKKRNNTENLVKSEQQDSQTEIYNLGASTSAALRLSLQKRNNKSKRSEGSSRSRRLKREKYSLRNNERQMPKTKRGKHLDSESSHSSTSTNSSSTSSFSDNTSSTDLSTSCSDEDYVANLPQRRRPSSSVRADNSSKRRKTKKTKKRKSSNGSTSYSRAKREAKKSKLMSSDDSSEDDDGENNGHMGKNFALVMAISERLHRQQNQSKRSSNRKAPTHTTRERIRDDNENEGENSWRLKAGSETLRRQQLQQQQQQQRVKSSLRSNERKRHHKSTNSQEQSRQRTTDTYREKDDKNTRRRSKTEKPTVSDSEAGKPHKIRKFDYDESSSSDESDNINLIQLKTKLTGQDQLNKEANGDSKSVSHICPTEQNKEHLETLSDTQATNNMNNSNDVTVASGTETTENSKTHTIIPSTNTTSDTNEIPTNNLPSTSQHKTIAALTAAASAIEENNFIESVLKNDFNNSSDDSNDNYDDYEDNGQSKRKHINSDDETLNNNDNHQMNNNNNNNDTENHQQPEETCSSLLANHNNSTNIVNLKNPYHSDVTEDDEDEVDNNRDDDDEDDIDDVDVPPPSKISLNTNLNVFADATSMTSTTTTDTILHDAAEQISSAAVNFYNAHQQEQQHEHEQEQEQQQQEQQQQEHQQQLQLHEQQQQHQQQQQQPFNNSADFGDENSTNTSSSSDTSLISSSTSTSSSSSSSSSISNSYNTNIFMNFKNV